MTPKAGEVRLNTWRMMSSRWAAVVLVAASCGGPTKSPAEVRVGSSVERLIGMLEHGEPLFGLGDGCVEWRATPADTDGDENEMEDGKADEVTAHKGAPNGWLARRNLTAQTPDAEGRIHM